MIKTTLIKAVRAGAGVLREYFDREYKISSKDTINNLVTEVDQKSEELIIRTIREEFPGHQILSEEIGELASGSETKWIIDPIDGTVNFAHHLPLCCVSIGVEQSGNTIMGAVYNPFLEEFFFAEAGSGATLNGKPICVSANSELDSSFLVTGFPYNWNEGLRDPVEVFGKLIRKGIPVRRLGSAAIDLCWVACGRFDGFWEHSLREWDVAAGYLVVREAGGRVTDHEGNPYTPYSRKLLATNGRIHDPMLQVLAQTT